MSDVEHRLAQLEELGLSRRLRLISGPQGPTVLLDGNPVLLLCSNNYLGLADHPQVRAAAAEAAMRWGVGAGASRLVSGTMTIHRRLEEQLAAFERSPSCLLFGSGYLANIGVITALAGSGDVVFSDALNHASIIDGCRLSRAEIVELAEACDARLVVDEAHATGTFGPDGRGALAHFGLEGEADVIVGTLGKALGSYGAYVCAERELTRYLLNAARPFIFSTAPSPPAVAGALAALELLQHRPRRVERLQANARALRRALAQEGFAVAEEGMHIVPLVVGDAHDAVRMCEEAISRGVFAQAIRPPTVPEGTSRLRLAAMASHTASDMRHAAGALAEAARALELDPADICAPAPPFEHAAGEPEAEPEHEPIRVIDARAGAGGPFDYEREEAPRGTLGETAPFDLERETSVAHAA